ncbi:MAG: polysaccharide lyase [Bacteroidales bacterium]|nr:polysaccharide lyase [Bacteroidales bacterium]
MKIKYFCLFVIFCSFSLGIIHSQNVSPLYFNTFDEGDMKGSQRECHSKECHDCASEKIVFKDSPGKSGKSLHHVLWNCDERAELKVNSTGRAEIGDTRWYKVSYYWPENRGNGCLIAQFPTYPTKRDFRKGCRGVGSDIRLEGDGSVMFTFQRPTKDADITCTHHLIGMMEPKKWHTIIVHVKWTEENDGFVKIWWNGKKTVDIKKQATYWADEGKGPYFKVGAYKGDPWKGEEPFEIYTDDVYVFGEDAAFKHIVNYQSE